MTGKKHTSPEQFVKLWQAENSAEDVAKKLGITKAAVYSRAKKYRKHGVHLKKYRTNKLDVNALNKLIEELE